MTAAKETKLWYLPALGIRRVLVTEHLAHRFPATERFGIFLYLSVSALRTRNARSRQVAADRHAKSPPIARAHFNHS
jgi:hypothetical protein